MNTIIVYPGRFQPFGGHHKKVYEWACSKFGKMNVYVVTSDKVELPNSPLNFSEKKLIMKKSGVLESNIIQVKNPYKSDELLSKFNPNNTVAIFIYGQKDVGRIQYTKKDGSKGYFQEYNPNISLQPIINHSYILVSPHFSVQLPNFDEMSGTNLRKFISTASPQSFNKIMGWYDKNIHDLLKKNFNESIILSEGMYDKSSIKAYYESLCNAEGVTSLPIKFERVGKGGACLTFNPQSLKPLYISIDLKAVSDPEFAIIHELTHQILLLTKKYYGHDKRFKVLFNKLNDKYMMSEYSKVLWEHKKVLKEYITKNELQRIEFYADQLFRVYDIDVDLSKKHFFDRLNDPRNKEDISQSELRNIFQSVFKMHGQKISQMNPNAEAVIKSMNTDINLPFVFIWDQKNSEYDLVAKTILRKPGFKTTNRILKVEINENLILEGGAAGHLSHVYEDENLTFEDLKEIIKRSLEGKLDVEADVVEKTDGVNMFITYVNNEIKAARNKSTILNPMSITDVASKFEGRGAVKDAFVYAMEDLQKSFNAVNSKLLYKLFKNGKVFINLEIIYPETNMTISYGPNAYIQFHGLVEYDENGNELSRYPDASNTIYNLIKKANANVQDHFSIIPPNVVKLGTTDNYSVILKQLFNEIQKLQGEYGLSDNDRIVDYYKRFWGRILEEQFKITDEKIKEGLINRWSGLSKSFMLTKKNIPNEILLNTLKTFEVKDVYDLQSKNIKKFEDIILKLSFYVLKNVQNLLLASPSNTNKEIRNKLIDAIRNIKSSNDPTEIKKLYDQIRKINLAGGIKNLKTTEGIVFMYNGRMYKITGSFAPVNAILGSIKYK